MRNKRPKVPGLWTSILAVDLERLSDVFPSRWSTGSHDLLSLSVWFIGQICPNLMHSVGVCGNLMLFVVVLGLVVCPTPSYTIIF